MLKGRFTQRRVDALKPREETLDVRDSLIRGFGVRILPSGRRRFFRHSQISGTRVWQSIDGTGDMSLECVWERAPPNCSHGPAEEEKMSYLMTCK